MHAKASAFSAITAATYLEKPEDIVTLDVQIRQRSTDGTSHIAQIVFDAKAKNIRVVVENTGYRPVVAR